MMAAGKCLSDKTWKKNPASENLWGFPPLYF